MKRVLRSQADFKSSILRNQLTSLVLYEAITTTRAKSKDVIPFINHFFNKVKSADLNAKKLAHQTFFDENAVKKTFEDILPRYDEKDTTFVRSFRTAPRHGDSAEMVLISLIKPFKAEKKAAPTPKVKKEIE